MKGKKKGSGGKRKKNSANEPMVFMEEGKTIYGQIIAALGSSRFDVLCTDAITRKCQLRGSMYKSVWVQPNDIVLVSLRHDAKDTGDICKKYYPAEVKILRDHNLIAENFKQEAEDNQAEFEFHRI
ncbi:translation initiation factor 1A [Nematocida homosporus]|uniref:translation initiation factor 1A n=1 Tax=Nematocida homosporus TaxID=1912981 RepID=UPI00221F6EFD|nr:translation initiation factor 1A [Nematocida homosporus]KAI5184288.1 translation initiation factor 1A [Nematocida homosporus]